MRDGISRPTFILTAAAATLVSALPARTESNPFENVDWEHELERQAHACTSTCGSGAERTHYTIGDGPDARPGGYPSLRDTAIGKDASSGLWVAAIPLLCGCSAGATSVAVFARSANGPKLVGAIRQGDKQSVFFANGALHVATPHRLVDEPLWDGRSVVVCAYAVAGNSITRLQG